MACVLDDNLFYFTVCAGESSSIDWASFFYNAVLQFNFGFMQINAS